MGNQADVDLMVFEDTRLEHLDLTATTWKNGLSGYPKNKAL